MRSFPLFAVPGSSRRGPASRSIWSRSRPTAGAYESGAGRPASSMVRMSPG
jgi:hypothetical protein